MPGQPPRDICEGLKQLAAARRRAPTVTQRAVRSPPDPVRLAAGAVRRRAPARPAGTGTGRGRRHRWRAGARCRRGRRARPDAASCSSLTPGPKSRTARRDARRRPRATANDRRLRRAGAVAQRVVDQVAQQQAHAHRVGTTRRRAMRRVRSVQRGIGELRRHAARAPARPGRRARSAARACPLARRSLSSRSVIRSRISDRSRSSASRCSPSGTSSAFTRARVSGLRSSWLMASSSARLASSMPCRLRAMLLMRSASSPSSSRRVAAIGWPKSPRAETRDAGADVHRAAAAACGT